LLRTDRDALEKLGRRHRQGGWTLPKDTRPPSGGIVNRPGLAGDSLL
jgi:hypothetical protein